MEEEAQKGHKKRKSGAKFNKKKKRKVEDVDPVINDDARKRNPKAFSFQVHTYLPNNLTFYVFKGGNYINLLSLPHLKC